MSENDPVFEELDADISLTEVRRCLSDLKRNKAPGNDNILNEYLIETGDILISHITDLFNLILKSGHFPHKWMEGIIVPVFKKGSDNDVRNFRGITLVSSLAKLFSSVINKRLYDWRERNNVISDAQFGFRKGFSTVDAIFALHSLIEHYINNGKRLYCGYIDMRKCFDSIYRTALWFKLYKLGINGKMLKIVRSMYDQVRCQVKHCEQYSDFMNIVIGLKQGEICSPLLY